MGESAHILLPTKFMLIVIQILLLVTALSQKHQHLHSSATDALSSEKSLAGFTISWMCFCTLEFLMMLIGSSVPSQFQMVNLLQVLLHLLGIVFTAWFVIDSWPARDLLPLWICFSIFPLVLEGLTVVEAFKF
jgi:hypothetical protein